MGIDAPSTDLTARIRAKRAALVAAGEVDPARPGEHVKHGTNPGAMAHLERVAAAAEARERRGRTPEVVPDGKVYEFEYLDGEQELVTAEPEYVTEDEDEADLLGAEDDPEPSPELSEEELAVLAERRYAEGVLTAPTDAPMRLAVIEEQNDGIAAALVLIANRLAELPDSADLAEAIKQILVLAASDARPPVGMIRQFFRWLW